MGLQRMLYSTEGFDVSDGRLSTISTRYSSRLHTFLDYVTRDEKCILKPAGVNTKKLYTKCRSFTPEGKQNTEDEHLNNVI